MAFAVANSSIAGSCPRLHPCTSSSRNVTNSSRWTSPCSTLVRPLAKVRMLTPSVNTSSTMLPCSTPRIIGWWVQLLTISIAGTVSPIVDNTDPRKMLTERQHQQHDVAMLHPQDYRMVGPVAHN